VSLDIAPLAPPDLDSPYASRRDAARHRLQATLLELEMGRNVKAGLVGFAEAFSLDRTYALAAFNLGIVAAIAGKWEDAIPALEEAARLDSKLAAQVASQLERLRLIRRLEATPEGKRRRGYDEALYPVLRELPRLSPAEAIAELAAVGKIDPKRWEAPASLAGLSGGGRTYDVAARFLEIAVANAEQPAIKERLQKALEAAQRELRYAAVRAVADATADRAEYDKAGELYEKTWAVIPARAGNGMEAASAWLLNDDTAHAAALLVRLRGAGDSEFDGSAAAMLKELEAIEPAAKAAPADAADFFRDPGSANPVLIADLLPPIDPSEMELLGRPLPELVADSAPVVLLAALSADAAEVSHAGSLPALPPSRIPGDHPWLEISQLPTSTTVADPASPPQARGAILVESSAPLELRVNGTRITDPTPLELSLQPGYYRVASGKQEREINVKPGARLKFR
jgi:hypothetical protein